MKQAKITESCIERILWCLCIVGSKMSDKKVREEEEAGNKARAEEKARRD